MSCQASHQKRSWPPLGLSGERSNDPDPVSSQFTDDLTPTNAAFSLQDNHVSEPEALPAAASPLGSGTLSPMSPVQEHYVDHQRLPQFGGPGVCDEEMELEKTDPAEAGTWRGNAACLCH
eukprot:g27619.t1